MIRTLLGAAIVISAFSSGGDMGNEQRISQLERFQWKNRLLFVFAPTREDPSFDSFHTSLVKMKVEVEDRDLVVFEVLESGLSTEDGDPLGPESARHLRDRFGVPAGTLSVILVGKDGGVKLARQERINLEDIFALIDSMPMRQQEMLRKNRSTPVER